MLRTLLCVFPLLCQVATAQTRTVLCEDNFTSQTTGCIFTDDLNIITRQNNALHLNNNPVVLQQPLLNHLFVQFSQDLSSYDSLRMDMEIITMGTFNDWEITGWNQPLMLPVFYSSQDKVYSDQAYLNLKDELRFESTISGRSYNDMIYITTSIPKPTGKKVMFATNFRFAEVESSSWGYKGAYDMYAIRSSFCKTMADVQHCMDHVQIPSVATPAIQIRYFKATGIMAAPLDIEDNELTPSDKSTAKAYTIMGQVIEQPSLFEGVLIYRYQDGSTRKVVQHSAR